MVPLRRLSLKSSSGEENAHLICKLISLSRQRHVRQLILFRANGLA